MSAITLKNASLVLNSVDLSAYIQSVTFNRTKDTPQITAMGDDSHVYLGDGLRNATISVTFKADYDSGTVDATLATAYDSDTAVTFVLKPQNAATSTSNPAFSGSVIVTDYTPLGGSIGDAASQTASLQVTGDVSRATS